MQIGSLIGSQIYRADDSPYYYRGNKVLISIAGLTLLTFICQRQYLIYLNKRKERDWERLSLLERSEYQNNQGQREADGNKRWDFRFKY